MSTTRTPPSPRVLLTSLFNSLPHPAPHTDVESGLGLPVTTTTTINNTNPLKDLPPSHRSFIITLHVLFPSLLLQALDLLDRNLVTHAIQIIPSAPSSALPHPQASPSHQPPQIPKKQEKQQQQQHHHHHQQENSLYLVRSAQSTRSRNNAASSARYGTTYTVRPHAWNCSCAAFAFSAFPASTSGSFTAWLDDDERGDAQGALEGEEERVCAAAWEFGGLSRDRRGSLDGIGGSSGAKGDGEVVPCCKHLLACVLADRWGEVLGSYVRRVRVGREEMAGLGADGSL